MPSTAIRFVCSRISVMAPASSMTFGFMSAPYHRCQRLARRSAESVLVEVAHRSVVEVDLDRRCAAVHRDPRKLGRRIDHGRRPDGHEQIALLQELLRTAERL